MTPLLLTLTLGCQPDPEPAVPVDSQPTVDTADSAPTGFSFGDPIRTLGSEEAPSGKGEWMDAAAIGQGLGLLVGWNGWGVASMETGQVLVQMDSELASQATLGFHVAVDGDKAWVANRRDGLYRLDLSEPLTPVIDLQVPLPGGYHEDIAAHSGRVLVGAQEAGALLLDRQGQTLATLPSSYAYGVGLSGDRALVSDGEAVVLFALDGEARELHRIELGATAQDIDFDGQQAAVALGGRGAAVLRVQGDQLELWGRLRIPGAAFSVSLDGEDLWIGAWDTVALAWLGGEQPVVVGHEEPAQSAMGLAAHNGRALVADWELSTAMQRVPGVGGPELELPDTLWFDPTQATTRSLQVRSWGALPLTVGFEGDGAFTASPEQLTLAPGEAQTVSVYCPGGGTPSALSWTSDDPDEPSGQIVLQPANTGVGAEHPNFQRRGFLWPERDQQTYRLSDQLGSVVLLAYFTTW